MATVGGPLQMHFSVGAPKRRVFRVYYKTPLATCCTLCKLLFFRWSVMLYAGWSGASCWTARYFTLGSLVYPAADQPDSSTVLLVSKMRTLCVSLPTDQSDTSAILLVSKMRPLPTDHFDASAILLVSKMRPRSYWSVWCFLLNSQVAPVEQSSASCWTVMLYSFVLYAEQLDASPDQLIASCCVALS